MLLVLYNIRSAYNVGSMFRTADAVGVEKIYLCGYTPTPAHKTALGAEASVPWEHHAQAWRLLKKLKHEGIALYGLEQHATSRNLFDFKPEHPMALIVGNELTGIRSSLLSYTDAILEIPMYGTKESLNVAVATGIALYRLKAVQ